MGRRQRWGRRNRGVSSEGVMVAGRERGREGRWEGWKMRIAHDGQNSNE